MGTTLTERSSIRPHGKPVPMPISSIGQMMAIDCCPSGIAASHARPAAATTRPAAERAPALALGVATVVAPFFILQPGLGAGIAASKTPRPNAARLRSLVTHAVFGLGLYISAWLATPLFRS
ncbi:hypothetical protein CDO44_00395 [Pigmentiphaga sp. NML080357]|nr:hypothetical protein CDO44_00395 [Pigmentiphaga sp. NML080357]